jgi:hypothetical protein
MPRTAEELKQGAMWVHYEFQTLLYSHRANVCAVVRQSDSMLSKYEQGLWHTLNTCTLEAFLLHYRNLKQFLNNLKYADDVKAEHYSDSWSGHSNLQSDCDEDERLNRLLAHISYSRGTLKRGNWDMPAMESNICATFHRFLHTVRPDLTHLLKRSRDELQNRDRARSLNSSAHSTATTSTWEIL